MRVLIAAECPHCGDQTHLDTSNEYRPFCSERCRLLDLGDWVNEEHKIAGREFSDPGFDGDTFSAATERSSKH